MTPHESRHTPWIGWLGLIALWMSVLGWGVWWAVCNVYEFAPRLPTWPVAIAGCVAVAALLPDFRRNAAPWLLALANALVLLCLHRDWPATDLIVVVWMMVSMGLLWRGFRRNPAKQTAGEGPAV